MLPYHERVATYLEQEEKKIWAWIGEDRRKPEFYDSVRLDLLKATYHLNPDTHVALYAAEASKPLDSQTICERALAEGYWKTNGKTPQATFYAAMIREIAAKGEAAGLKKVDRGQFTTAN